MHALMLSLLIGQVTYPVNSNNGIISTTFLHDSSLDLHLNDDVVASFGGASTSPDCWYLWDTSTTPDSFALVCTDIDGGGTDGPVYRVHQGTDDMVLAGRIYNASGALNVGTAATTSHSLGSGDVLIGGASEVNGDAHFDGNAYYYGNLSLSSSGYVYLNSAASYGAWRMVTGAFQWGIGDGSGTGNHNLVFTSRNNILKQHDHPLNTDPHVYGHSATDPDTDNTQFWGLYHDKTNVVLESGKGSIHLDAADNEVLLNDSWTCRRFQAGSVSLGPTAPDTLVNGSFTGKGFDAAAETIFINEIVPYQWTGDTDGTFGIEWTPEVGDAIQLNETVKWNISFRSIAWGTEDTDNGTAATDSITYTETANPGDANDTHTTVFTLDWDNVAQPVMQGDRFGVTISRDTATDTYSGQAIVMNVYYCFYANHPIDYFPGP